MNIAEGQRVVYRYRVNPNFPNQFVAASMGGNLVMHLSARDETGQIKAITGVIGKVINLPDGSCMYDFYPDGWQCQNESGWPRGFQCSEKNLAMLKDKSLCLPGTITDPLGRRVEA